jgi:hypothetical protein
MQPQIKSSRFHQQNPGDRTPINSTVIGLRNALQIIKHWYRKFLCLCHLCIIFLFLYTKWVTIRWQISCGSANMLLFSFRGPLQKYKNIMGWVIAMEMWKRKARLEDSSYSNLRGRPVGSSGPLFLLVLFFCHAVSVSRGPQCRLGMQLSTPLLKRKTYAARRSDQKRHHLPTASIVVSRGMVTVSRLGMIMTHDWFG